MNRQSLKKQNIVQLLLTLAIVVLTCYIGSFLYVRADLTQEKRYTLSDVSKKVLKTLPDAIYIKVYLYGDMPLGFKKLSNNVKETLDEFRLVAGDNIQYQFVDPYENKDSKLFQSMVKELYDKGIQPTNVKIKGKNGEMSEKLIIPGMLLSYNGIEIAVNLLSNNPGLTAEQNLNNSIESIEYLLISNLKNITNKKLDKIAFLEGQGELDQYQVGDITRELSNFYQIDRGSINGNYQSLAPYKVVIITKPQQAFTEEDKFVLDQYIMNGGKVLWLTDVVNIDADSMVQGYSMAFIPELNINDQLFKYGIRINPVLLEDVQCAILPVNTSITPGQPKFSPLPWLYYPLLNATNHALCRNVGLIKSEFCSYIDTLKPNGNIKHTVLLTSSKFTKLVNVPVMVTLAETRKQPQRNEFNRQTLPVAVLVEGNFESAFKNRMINHLKISNFENFKPQSVNTRIIVVADGDIIKNTTRQTAQGTLVSPLGYDRYTQQTFGNKEFILNAVNYLTDDDGLMDLRARQVKMRLLNKTMVNDELFYWQLINLALPVLTIIILGVCIFYIRKYKYSK
jgi:ABC-2 type transport system permease protein